MRTLPRCCTSAVYECGQVDSLYTLFMSCRCPCCLCGCGPQENMPWHQFSHLCHASVVLSTRLPVSFPSQLRCLCTSSSFSDRRRDSVDQQAFAMLCQAARHVVAVSKYAVPHCGTRHFVCCCLDFSSASGMQAQQHSLRQTAPHCERQSLRTPRQTLTAGLTHRLPPSTHFLMFLALTRL